MPEVDRDRARRGGQLPSGLLWAGVGLTPLAALVLLLSAGGGVLFALGVVLAMVAVALIGLSVALRPDRVANRPGMEDMLLEEIEVLREDLRRDISTAARATHHAFEDRLQAVQRSLDTVRGEWESARGAVGGIGAAAPVGQHPPMVVTASAAAPVVAAAPAPGAPGEVYAAAANPDAHRPAAGRAHVPTGVVRHTETVHHVTTRSTFVGQHGGQDHEAEAPYEPAYPAKRAAAAATVPVPDWSPPPPPRRAAAGEAEESWTDRMLRERYGTPAAGEGWTSAAEGEGRGGRRRRAERNGSPGEGRPDEPEGWAFRRADERGQELRLGERRAAMRASGAGTEMRIEDRWAAVRRDWDRDPGDGGRHSWDPPGDDVPSWDGDAADGGRHSRDRADGDRRSWGGPEGDRSWGGPEGDRSWGGPEGDRSWGAPEGDRSWGGGRDGGAPGWESGDRDSDPPRREQRALPAASESPSWNADWEEPVREPRERRRRSAPGSGYAGTPRRPTFETSDERWR